jgi:hypothetical protein
MTLLVSIPESHLDRGDAGKVELVAGVKQLERCAAGHG